MTVSEQKKALRREIRTLMGELPALCDQEEKFMMDVRLHRRVEEHPWMQEADVVLSYCSMRNEPDTRGLIGWMLYMGIPVALPVCLTRERMEFYHIHSLEEIRPGAYGILEPTVRERITITDKTLCIVPGLAFTKSGLRLGRGGGYYDRFLSEHPQMRTMGLTYQCLLQEDIPCEEYDRPVDIVITEI